MFAVSAAFDWLLHTVKPEEIIEIESGKGILPIT